MKRAKPRYDFDGRELLTNAEVMRMMQHERPVLEDIANRVEVAHDTMPHRAIGPSDTETCEECRELFDQLAEDAGLYAYLTDEGDAGARP